MTLGYKPFSFFLALILFFAASAMLPAQTTTGSISGSVRDATGQVLPGVSITLEGQALISSQVTTSNETGGYRFPAIPPGSYIVRFELQGFGALNREGVIVNAGRNTAIDVTLELAGVAETVTVTGESPMVDTKSTVIGASFDEETLNAVPSARDVWSLLEHQAPGVTTNRLDVGGSETGLQAIYSARGTAWMQNSYYLNGVNVTCPAALGASGYYYDYDSFEEVQVEVGSHPASVNAPGVYMNMMTKAGGNQFRGGGSFFYQNKDTQWDNVDAELIAGGVNPETGGGFDFLSDVNAQIGGPIARDRSNFYFSWRDERVHRFVAGFPEVESTDMWQFLVKNQTQIASNHRVGVEWHHMSYYKPNRGAAATREPEATWIEDDTFDIIQAEWTATLSENALLDTRFSHLKVFFPTYQQPDARPQSTLDNGTGIWSNAYNLDVERDRRRYTFKSDLSYYLSEWAGGSHDWKFGFEWNHSPVENINTTIDDLELRKINGVADQVYLRNTTTITKENVNQLGLFVDDVWSIGTRATLKLGLRMDSYEGYLPAQASPGGLWVSEAAFPERRDIVSFTSFAPRVGFVLGLEENGSSVLKTSWGRYYHQFTTGWPGFANQNGNLFDSYEWRDPNGDGLFQDGEQGRLLSRGIAANNEVNPDMKHPYTDEFTIGVEKELAAGLSVSGTFSYRKGNRLHDSLDIGIPFSVYTTASATDPGPDGVIGSGDDGGQITVFAQDPTTLGNNQRQLTNAEVTLPTGETIKNETDYKGFELALQKRLSDSWSAMFSYTYNDANAIVGASGQESNTNSGIWETPNGLINTSGKPFWDRTNQLKLLGSYYAPYGIRISAVFRYQTGQPVARTFLVGGLPQGTFTVIAEPVGTRRLPNVATGDITIGKSFNPGFGMLTVDGSFFNIANANTVTGINTSSGSSYGNVTNFLSPRIFRFGLRYQF